jgi:sugar lactone lactonase YvrE
MTRRPISQPPVRTVKPAFGGSDLNVLFVTSIGARGTPSHAQPFAGGLFALTGLGVQGVPEVRFRG